MEIKTRQVTLSNDKFIREKIEFSERINRIVDSYTALLTGNRTHWPLYKDIRLAAEYLLTDPRSSLNKSRLILESVISMHFEMIMNQPIPDRATLELFLSQTQYTKHIDLRILGRMRYVQYFGNLGSHANEVTPADAERVIDNLCDILEWYLGLHGNLTASEPHKETCLLDQKEWGMDQRNWAFRFSFFDHHLYKGHFRPILERSIHEVFCWERSNENMFVFDEMVNNAIKHGCDGHGERSVEVRVNMDEHLEVLNIQVIDEGPGFDLNTVLNELAKSRPQGHGIRYIKNFVGEWGYVCGRHADGRFCAQVRLTRDKPKSHVHIRKIETTANGGFCVLDIDGEIDIYNAPEIKDTARALIESGAKQIIINIENVSYMDSSASGAFISIQSNLKKLGGRLIIIGVYEPNIRVFRLCGLTDVLEIYGDSSEIPIL